MGASPRIIKRAIAAAAVLCISPAALFMTSLFMRNVQPEQYEPARTASVIVTWYAGRGWTLWILLMALPFAVLVIGCATLAQNWHDDEAFRRAAQDVLAAIRAHMATLLIAASTLAAAGVLAIVVIHSLGD